MKKILNNLFIRFNNFPRIVPMLPAIICFIAIIFIVFFIFSPIAANQQSILESEIAKISPPNVAILLDKGTSNKFSQASVHERYYIDWDATELINYYSKELIEKGWSYKRQDIVIYQSVGQIYCKGDYTLDLNYYENNYEESYTIWIWWGNPSECDSENYTLYIHYAMFICYCFSLFLSLVIAFIYYIKPFSKKK